MAGATDPEWLRSRFDDGSVKTVENRRQIGATEKGDGGHRGTRKRRIRRRIVATTGNVVLAVLVSSVVASCFCNPL